MYYIGLDVHKKTISYCVKDGSGRICQEGKVGATRLELDRWMKTLPQPWTAAMEATMFTGWIYDHLRPHAAAAEGRSSGDAASHRGGEKEERQNRRPQDRRLSALRFSAGVLHGSDRDPGTASHSALSQPAGPAGGADEEPHLRAC